MTLTFLDDRPRGGWSVFRLVFVFPLFLSISCAGGKAPVSASSAERDSAAELPPQPLPEKFEAGFEGRLRAAAPRKRFRALVDLTMQVDLDALTGSKRFASASRSSRREIVIRALERVAERQQPRLRPTLERLVEEGSLDYWRPVAIVNRIVVEGRASGILQLAELSDVARVLPDWDSGDASAREAGGTVAATPLGERFTSWAIHAIGADTLWAEGIDGRGVVLAAIDTGVDEQHEQLAGRRARGERGWFDAVGGSERPFDSDGHGTGVLSLAVGGNPSGRVVGVAPGARWAMALGNDRNHYSRARMTLAADWILRTARPDVLVNAWSHDEGSCNAFDLPFISAWKASGIFVVFPAGNAGPRPSSGESPAQMSGVWPEGAPVFSVAASTSAGGILDRSSRGPSSCGSAAFPSLAAPGAGIPHAIPSGPEGYILGDGTSLAAAIVGGAAALLLQAVPGLTPEEIEKALVDSCTDVPPPGRDPSSGAGLIDLPAAIERARAMRSRKGDRR